MAWYGDPDALDALARQLERDADDVRRQAAALAATARAGAWRGDAAEAFVRAVDEDSRDLGRAAAGVDEAAVALRRHAAEVRARLARIRALEQAVQGWFSDQLGRLPAPGDKAWLEVGDVLRDRGVRL